MRKSMDRKRMFCLLGYVILACLFVLIFRPTYILTILIVLVPPSIVNFLWLKKSRREVLIFSAVTAILFAPPVELASRLADAWDVQSVFARPFGILPLENMLFAFLNFFWVASFYEYFIDRDTTGRISRRFRYLVGLYILFASAVFGLYAYDARLVTLNYAVVAVPVLLIPAAILFAKNPHLLKKSLIPTAFFAVVFFLYEMAALKIGNWWWPGEYLYTVTVFGKPFPLDDVVIWYLLSTPALIAGYEFFADDFS